MLWLVKSENSVKRFWEIEFYNSYIMLCLITGSSILLNGGIIIEKEIFQYNKNNCAGA